MKRLAVILLLLSCAASADERILGFHSDIVVMPDGWIDVTETIRVRAEGNRIRRGIYRDFPTEYEDSLGNDYVVDFDIVSVERNGQREDWHTQRIRDGVRTYFGSSDRFIEVGEHTYTFRYRASRMLGFFEAHDELYWNVTGVNWEFPIDTASATVNFAFNVGVDDLTSEAYTGAFGYTKRDYRAWAEAPARVHFETTRPLQPLMGLTIVVGWPKGHVDEPTRADRFFWLLQDNANLLIAGIGFIILLAYYIPVWRYFGKDPEEGVLVTRYEPPQGFSPASLRYIRQMYYDDKIMTAAIVNLAVKGYLKIRVTEGKKGFFRINSTPDKHVLAKADPGPNPPPLAAGEKELYDSLFSKTSTVLLAQENHGKLGAAKKAHKRSLEKDYKQRYFRYNGLMNLPAILLLLITVVMSAREGLTIFSVGVLALMAVTTVFFASIMKRPTLRGRKLLDEMLGFKDYLEIAEKDEMELRNPPEKTPQLFEKYLPFALALGVDQSWAEKFAGVLKAAQLPDGSAYQPTWYNGTWSNMDLSSATSSFSNGLSSAVAQSVKPPGSSSGSSSGFSSGGGGGFSGGGGGGGGGGGW